MPDDDHLKIKHIAVWRKIDSNVSGCCHSAVEVFTPLGCCMVLIYSCLFVFWDCPVFKGQYGTDTLSWNVRNNWAMLRITEEWRPQVVLHVIQDVELISKTHTYLSVMNYLWESTYLWNMRLSVMIFFCLFFVHVKSLQVGQQWAGCDQGIRSSTGRETGPHSGTLYKVWSIKDRTVVIKALCW